MADRYSATLDTIHASKSAWSGILAYVHASHARQPLLLVGLPSTGKTTLLNEIEAQLQHTHSICHVRPDDFSDQPLKSMLISANDAALGEEGRPRIWLIDDLDDSFSEADVRNIEKYTGSLLQHGFVVATTTHASVVRAELWNILELCPWSFQSRVLYLDIYVSKRTSSREDLQKLLEECGGSVQKAESVHTFYRGTFRNFTKTVEPLCGATKCLGDCALCTKRRNIPFNDRFLVEDSLCPRASQAKYQLMESRGTDDLVCDLMQEMVPLASGDDMSKCAEALDRMSAVDITATAGDDSWNAMMSDGLLPRSLASTNVEFSSGFLMCSPRSSAIPSAASKNTAELQRKIQLSRGISPEGCFVRRLAGSHHKEDEIEVSITDPRADLSFLSFVLERDLYAAARGKKNAHV